MTELTVGIAGALIGALVTYLLGAKDRRLARVAAEAQRKLAELEEDKRKWDSLERFSPKAFVVGEPPREQLIRLESEEEFEVTDVEYLTSKGVVVSRQSVRKAGKTIDVPVEDSRVLEIQMIGPRNSWDGSAHINFRIHLRVSGREKTHMVNGLIKHVMVGNTQYRKILA